MVFEVTMVHPLKTSHGIWKRPRRTTRATPERILTRTSCLRL